MIVPIEVGDRVRLIRRADWCFSEMEGTVLRVQEMDDAFRRPQYAGAWVILDQFEDSHYFAFHQMLSLDAPRLGSLEVNVRTINILERLHISTVRGLLSRSERELRKVKHLGPRHIEEIKEALGAYGLSLPGGRP